uniref:Uncharacterized protein n=1 Tax=Octopus bimaculoides TaxID=37653 RepID=A0A0L8H3J8_OCTBM
MYMCVLMSSDNNSSNNNNNNNNSSNNNNNNSSSSNSSIEGSTTMFSRSFNGLLVECLHCNYVGVHCTMQSFSSITLHRSICICRSVHLEIFITNSSSVRRILRNSTSVCVVWYLRV